MYGLRKESPAIPATMLIGNTLVVWIEFSYYIT
jgi:hypothetical protein